MEIYEIKESMKTPVTSDNSFVIKLTFIYSRRIGAKFIGTWLLHDNMPFTHRNVVNSFIAHELYTLPRYSNANLTLGECLFAVKLAKNADPDKYGYSDYGTGFSQLLLPVGELGKNVVIFRVDTSSFVNAGNKKRTS